MSDMRSFVKSFIRAHNTTLAGLAQSLGYRSKTTIERIMNSKVRSETVRGFDKALRHSFDLTQEESDALAAAVELKIYGREISAGDRELWKLLRKAEPDHAPQILLHDVLSDALSAPALPPEFDGPINLTMLNCLHLDFNGIRSRLDQYPHMQVQHYIQFISSEASNMGFVRNILPLLYHERYHVYVRFCHSAEDVLHGAAAADATVREYQTEDGWHEDLCFFQGQEEGTRLATEGCGMFSKLLNIRPEAYEPVKQVFAYSGTANSYLAFLSHCIEMEANRGILMLKPDLCMELIPASVILSCAAETLGASPEEYLAFERLLKKREEVNLQRSRPGYFVFKQGAMLRFAQTGVLQDQFWAARPMTVAERITVFETLLEALHRNPAMHIFFLTDDDIVRDIEVIQYQKLGMMILSADQHYTLDPGFTDTLVVHKATNEFFYDFFMRQIICESCLSADRSEAILREMMEVAMAH